MRVSKVFALFAIVSACGDFQPAGLEEPLFVEFGVFHQKPMPGFEPGEFDGTGPRVTGVLTGSTILRPGELGREFSGNVTSEAHAVGIQIEGLGSGWWGSGVLGPDTFVPGEYLFQIHADIGDVPPGRHRVRFVAIDEDGNGGPYFYVPVCVPNQVPDNRNGCDPTRMPPATVVTLQFSNRADVDLILKSSDGRVVDGARPGGVPNHPDNPRLDRNSNTNCVPDGFNRENIVFQEDPAEGFWDVHVNLFHACGEAATTFVVEVYKRVDHGDGTYGFESTERHTGVLRAADANGGTGAPLYVTTIHFP